MTGLQLLDGVLVALAVLVSLATAISLAMLAAASVTRPGQAPHGGIRRDLSTRSRTPTTPARSCCADRSVGRQTAGRCQD